MDLLSKVKVGIFIFLCLVAFIALFVLGLAFFSALITLIVILGIIIILFYYLKFKFSKKWQSLKDFLKGKNPEK